MSPVLYIALGCCDLYLVTCTSCPVSVAFLEFIDPLFRLASVDPNPSATRSLAIFLFCVLLMWIFFQMVDVAVKNLRRTREAFNI